MLGLLAAAQQVPARGQVGEPVAPDQVILVVAQGGEGQQVELAVQREEQVLPPGQQRHAEQREYEQRADQAGHTV